MTINYEKLKAWQFPALEHHYTERDTILYALGLGFGANPLDEGQLAFVYEEKLKAVPTLAVVLAYPGFWARNPETGIDWRRVLHGEQGLVIHRPLPPAGAVVGRTRITEILDKGKDKGAILYSSRDVHDKATGDLLCTVSGCAVLRGDGGFGGPTGPQPAPHPTPERAPDLSLDLPTLPQAALIYRLSGDYNPLHADPKVAAAAGFPRPILHGLCTYGIAGHALLNLLCDYNPTRLRRMDCRFTAPVFPGETLRTEIWREGNNQFAFRCRVVERDRVVLNNGMAETL